MIKNLVTHLSRHLYSRSWFSGTEKWSTCSMGISILTYLFLLRTCHHEIIPGQLWSAVQLQHVFQLRDMTTYVEHNVKAKIEKVRKEE